MEGVRLDSESEIREQIGRVLAAELLGVDHRYVVGVERPALQVIHHGLTGLQHQRQYPLQLVLREGRRHLAAQVLPTRILQAEKIPHTAAIQLAVARKVAVGEILEVANQDVPDDLGIAYQQAGLMEDVEADVRRVPPGLLVHLADVPSRRTAEEQRVFHITENQIGRDRLDATSLPVV